ncbi:60 kDa SS-A/Ro ribonucleoprotein [Mactra antiquata]
MANPIGTTTPQSEPLFTSVHGEQKQVANNAGGYVFKLDDMKRALRFLIMGSESGQYYAKEKDITRDNVTCIDRLIGSGRGVELVQLIKDVSVSRRNVRQDSLILAYAICARSNDKDTKKAAYAILSDVCRIPTHLFMFVQCCETESSSTGTGWGRAHKRGVCKWYSSFQDRAMKLAELITKYKRRGEWTHKDLLRLSHVTSEERSLAFLYRYVAKDLKQAKDFYVKDSSLDEEGRKKLMVIVEYIEACEEASVCQNEDELCYLIERHKLCWEHCNSKWLKSRKVWFKLIPHMGIEALIRNLGRMTSYGMFAVNSEDEQMVLDRIRTINEVIESMEEENDTEPMETDDVMNDMPQAVNTVKRRNMIHPFKILLGLMTYKSGHGEKGHLSWLPNPRIVEALDKSFYQAFDAVPPTGLKYYLAVDVSGSMSQPVLGSGNIFCSTAAACMMMVIARTEENCIIRGFCEEMRGIEIDGSDTLSTVQTKMEKLTFGGTDCAKPMMDAMECKIKDIDVFVVFTDNETWYGKVHPSEALKQYRMYSERREAKLIVCGMSATEFTIADNDDPGMLDIAGFDSASPRLISEFAKGNI